MIMKMPDEPLLIASLAGAIAGILVISLLRLSFQEGAPHYHANFAVFINGERESFESDLYYEEVAACSNDYAGPRSRVHLHKPDSDVVHVHDEGATWGNLFENIRWSLGNDFIKTDTDFYRDNEENDLVFILNGQKTKNIANAVINSEDRLLISYGPENDDREDEYVQIGVNASEFNDTADPGACQGSDGESFGDRLRRAFLW